MLPNILNVTKHKLKFTLVSLSWLLNRWTSKTTSSPGTTDCGCLNEVKTLDVDTSWQIKYNVFIKIILLSRVILKECHTPAQVYHWQRDPFQVRDQKRQVCKVLLPQEEQHGVSPHLIAWKIVQCINKHL